MSKLINLLPKLKGELLEICVGDEYEEIITADSTRKVNGVLYGKLVDIVDDFLIIDSFFLDKEGRLQSGNILYLNSWAIKMFTKVKSNGCLNDALLSASHTRKIKYLLGIDD